MSDSNSQIRHALGSSGEPPAESVARVLSELARELRAEPDMSALLDHIVAATVAEIDGAEHGGITLITGQKVQAVAATGPVVRWLDELQNDVDQGPCLSSLRESVTVRSDDFAAEDRWPRFTGAARDQNIQSMLSVQLFVEGDNLGALNLYGTETGAFSAADEYTAMALAAHAAVAMKGSRVENNLRTAVSSRDIIGQAKGILMERYKIDQEAAVGLLIAASQRTHHKLRDIADELAATGELRAG